MVFSPVVRLILQNYECYEWFHTYYVLHKVCTTCKYIKLGTAISHLFCLKMSTTSTVVCATSQLPPTNWVGIAKLSLIKEKACKSSNTNNRET